jgi:TFIIF-interacting CTD phosphatase-like protein
MNASAMRGAFKPSSTIGMPEPTEDYILATSFHPHRSTSPTTKLLILDLNGTLVYRPRNPAKDRDLDMLQVSMTPILRPHLEEFMTYIFEHFKVMFWSSATPRNVQSMIAATTTPEQRSKVIAIWARDTLDLSPEDYNKKSVTFKDLRKVFVDKDIANASEKEVGWNIESTILLDDSAKKASYQPYNHVCVPEFVNNEQDDALKHVVGYLEELRHQDHVARFIKQKPFKMGAVELGQ